jgi:hypothetical protein
MRIQTKPTKKLNYKKNIYVYMDNFRGLPGSGKSFLAKQIVSEAHSKLKIEGIILSTDDFFYLIPPPQPANNTSNNTILPSSSTSTSTHDFKPADSGENMETEGNGPTTYSSSNSPPSSPTTSATTVKGQHTPPPPPPAVLTPIDKSGLSYNFNPARLGEAHEWNFKRAVQAISVEQRPLVIIDNTHVQRWEAKKYVALAVEQGYTYILKKNYPSLFL